MSSGIDPKVVERIQKLLRLARDGGATEGEANNAMEMAERIMLANNLSMAQVELTGEKGTEARLKQGEKGRANYRWQRWLMSAIAEANFCVVLATAEKRKIRHGYRDYITGYELIGKVSNIAASRHMYDYLLQTCSRLREEYESQPGNGTSEGALFVEGLSYRLAQRIKERHDELLKVQREEAEAKKREEETRSRHPSAAPTGTSLVVIMEDYAAKEADLNNDIKEGWKPGTTLAKRNEREAKAREEERRINELMMLHSISWEIAWNMVNLNHSLEEAQAYQARWDKEREEPARHSRYRGGKDRGERLHERLYTGAAGDGRRRAESVSLNTQVGGKGTRRIS